MNFSIQNNKEKRQHCVDMLKDKIPWQPTLSHQKYLNLLSTFQFCISPEGNGVDCHRLWEALYVHTVPIVLRNPLHEMLVNNYHVPLCMVDKWEELNLDLLNYSNYSFNNLNNILDCTEIITKIKNCK